MLELRLLGQFDVRLGEERLSIPSRPAQSLLAYLALSAGTAHRREKLAALLWPEASEDNARSYLRHALWRARKAIEGERRAVVPYILADELSVAFNPRSSYDLDVATLERGITSGASSDDLRRDLDVYRGELLPGFVDEWVGPERDRVEGLFERGMQRLIEQLSAERRWQDVVESAERWISLVHAPEAAFRAMMLAHSALGDRARVAATYDRCRRALFEDLGVEPSAQTRALYAQLAREAGVEPPTVLPQPGAPPLADARAPTPGEPPYKGLQSFDEADAALFFGRELIVARLAERLLEAHVLAVVGASGSGKSSVVRAGLVPAWRERQSTRDGQLRTCAVFVITPTARPLEALAACLTGASSEKARAVEEELAREPDALRQYIRRRLPTGARVLLVVDQFEELFSLCRDGFQREAFIENLLAAGADTLDLVIALRADFYDSCGQYPSLRDALGEHQEYLGPMSPDELRRAIEAPALAADWELEEGLVDIVLRDAGEEPGALPLVSHALLETWLRRSARTLTLRGYAASGGVQGAIARTAESVFTEQLSSTQQDTARRVFVQLTELGDGTQDTRRRATLDELAPRPADRAAFQSVLQALADARLITASQDTVEVAHEALIREWPRLRGWLDEDRAWLRSHRQLAEAARDWERLGRDPDALYRGARLAQTLEWRDRHQAELSTLEQDFVEASSALAQRETADREARQQRELEVERRANARLRTRAIYLGAAFFVALLTGGMALFFGRQAELNATAARSAARLATSRELAAAAVVNLPVDPERSILLALQAVSATRGADGFSTPEATDALHQAVLASRALLAVPPATPGAAILGVAFSPDGSRIASNSEDGTTRIYDSASGQLLLALSGDDKPLHSVAFSPDGARVATTGASGIARLWDAASGEKLLEIHAHPDGLYKVNFSPDGRMFAAGDNGGTTHIWDTASGAELFGLPADSGQAFDVQFSPDGSRVATSGLDGWARVWELSPVHEVLAIPGTSKRFYAGPWRVAWSPDGRQLAVVDYREAYVWDLAQGREVQRFRGHTNDVLSVVFSPDGTRLATAGLDRGIRIWDVATGRALFVLAGHTDIIYSIAFSPDGTRLVSGGNDGTTRVWDLGPAHELLALPDSPPGGRLTFSADGKRIVVAASAGRAFVWDAVTGEQLLSLRSDGSTTTETVAASPDGRLLATSNLDGFIQLWDSASGSLVRRWAAANDRVLGLAFSPDSRRLATAGGRLVKVWDLSRENSDPVVMTGHTNEALDVAFSPDGRLVASGSIDRTARLWDAATGAEVRRLVGHTDNVWGVRFSPDGTRLATASRDGTGGVWDVASGKWLLRLTGHTSTVVWTVFSPDGRYLATASRDGTAKIWDSATGGELLTLHGGDGGLNGVAFSPDGTRLATGGEFGVWTYALPIDDVVQLARQRLTRGWTLDECRRYLHVDHCPSAS